MPPLKNPLYAIDTAHYSGKINPQEKRPDENIALAHSGIIEIRYVPTGKRDITTRTK